MPVAVAKWLLSVMFERQEDFSACFNRVDFCLFISVSGSSYTCSYVGVSSHKYKSRISGVYVCMLVIIDYGNIATDCYVAVYHSISS